MAKPQVTLTFAGDHKDLEKSFEAIGDSSKKMGDEVESSVSSFDKATDASDALDTKAMGFRDTITGVQDSVSGFSSILKGDFSGDALFTAGAGVGDLASGFTNLLGPALGKAVGWLAQTRVGMLAQAAATKIMIAAQWLWNAAMSANPIGLIIIAIVAVVAVLVLLYTKSETARKIMDAVFRGIVGVVKWWFNNIVKRYIAGVIAGFQLVVGWGKKLWEGIKLYFGFWKGVLDKAVGWVKDIPKRVGRALSGLASAISAPFRAGFDAVRQFWNNTLGGKGFSVPSWVPGFGGKEFRLPYFHKGGIVPGAPGEEMLAVLQAGERVTPAGGSGGAMVLEVRSGGSRLDDLLVEILARAVRTRGGNVQVVLGRG